MEESTPITPNLRENLVAYLDGELDEADTLEVERTLTESAEIRQEVEALSRTWDLLDQLPRVRASSEFTERTMASIQAASTVEVARPWISPETKKRIWLASLLAGLAACAVLGFLVTNRGLPDKTEALMRDLPVIEQVDLYEEVGDVEFLRELEQLGPLSEASTAESPNGNQ
jgi:anti-sigma factor RsiW